MVVSGLCDRPLFSFLGAGCTKAGQFTKERGTAVEAERLQKVQLAVAGLEAEGL